MSKILPFHAWKYYLGYHEESSIDEDKIMFFNFGGHTYKLEIGYEHELTFQNKMNQT
ncbi:hypothetical protein [Leptotrichia trevisanii]|uniref:hypothetical protein n=1 Tax=Leptotrichia trevisanii TaxID=109328 RepID=UPI0026EB554F|nr:hypothetical protein [Leptotrichia trevisanii]